MVTHPAFASAPSGGCPVLPSVLEGPAAAELTRISDAQWLWRISVAADAAMVGERFHPRLHRATSNSLALPFSRERGQPREQHCSWGRMQCASASSLEARGSGSGVPNTARRQALRLTLRPCPSDAICGAWRHGRGGPISRESGAVCRVISLQDLQSSPCASRNTTTPSPPLPRKREREQTESTAR
jgi:hypothetical protein